MVVFLRKQWEKVVKRTNEVDFTFLLLRIFSLVGGVIWLLIVPLPPREKAVLVNALIYFFSYSILCYLIIFFQPNLLKKVYLASLSFDMIFLSNLVSAETNFESSFFLGYYLLICLHTIYFGLGFGLVVAFFSAACYVVSIFPMIANIEWTDLAIRICFLFFISIPVGLLSAKIKRDKEKVENFNRTLEIKVSHRTDRIRTLLDKERYLREILDTVAHINKLLITAPNITSLIESSCNRLGQHGHYDFCWIGLLENNEIKTIQTSDVKGPSLVDPPYDLYDVEGFFYKDTAAQCVREEQTVIRVYNPQISIPIPWRDPDKMKSVHAVISLPLRAQQSALPFGVLSIYTSRQEGFEQEEKVMLDELAGDIGFAIDSFRQRESVALLTAERTANYEETIFSFVDMIEQRDTYTAGHTQRVAQYCNLIGTEIGLENKQLKKLYKAAMLHDIGKIATPDSVLLKPGRLTNLDYDLIKLHAFAGYKMLSQIRMYRELAEVILHHHERHDGKGYPDGIKGDEIPLLSQIMVVGDAFDAMTTNRIYKSKKEVPEALAEIQSLSASQFNPEIVKAAIKVLDNVKISSTISQLPATNLEEKRFSYFFNDKLTGLYNEDYLKSVLNNIDLKSYKYVHILHLLNVPKYNKHYGWAQGNQLLKEFANELQARFPESLVFRVYGNDFAVICKKHFITYSNEFHTFTSVQATEVEVEVQHIDLSAEKAYTIDKLEKLEIVAIDPHQPLIDDTQIEHCH